MHEGHLGIEKCKRRARDVMYWPNMNNDVCDFVRRCDICQKHRYAQQQQPILSHERPDRPWAKVGCDIFYMKQKPYLLTIDYFSLYPETVLLTSETSYCPPQVVVLEIRHPFHSDVRWRSAILQCRVSKICRGMGL